MPTDGEKHPNLNNWFWNTELNQYVKKLDTETKLNKVTSMSERPHGEKHPDLDDYFWNKETKKYEKKSDTETSKVKHPRSHVIHDRSMIPVDEMKKIGEMIIGQKYMVDGTPRKLINQTMTHIPISVHDDARYKLEFDGKTVENVLWDDKYEEAKEGGSRKRVNHTKKSKSKKSRKNCRKTKCRH